MHESCVPFKNRLALNEICKSIRAISPNWAVGVFGWKSKRYQKWDEPCRIGHTIRAIYLSTANSAVLLQNV